MTAKNALRQIQLIIYKLKRSHGLAAILREPATTVNDITTGEITRTFIDTPIKRIIRLPRRNVSDFVFDLAFIASNKNFTYGAEFDTNDRWFILDIKDLPQDYRYPDPVKQITTEYYIIVDSRRYQVYECNLAEHNNAYLVRGREIVGSDNVS